VADLLVVGSVALDSVETPFGKVTVGLVCSIASKRDRSSTNLFISKPVPTRPA